jgi:hypothetical protein
MLLRILLLAVGLFLAGCAAFFAVGPERVWAWFGPADLGDVDFASLQRRQTPNDALACLPGICRAPADLAAPQIGLPIGKALALVRAALVLEPRLEEVAADPGSGSLRYVQRSRWLRFPDTINVKIIEQPEGTSTILLYSRSQLGRGDMGVNRARLERWISLIESEVQK